MPKPFGENSQLLVYPGVLIPAAGYQASPPACIDGWDGWDGWDGMDGMDGMGWMGWSVHFFFWAHILKTTKYFFIIVSVPLNRGLCTSFGIFGKKNSECSLFQKGSPKSKSTFFPKIFKRIYQISQKLLNIFSSLFLVPLEEIK